MIKIVHIITRLDSGGSAQNTLLTCLGLSNRFEQVLAHGLSLESRMTDWEKSALGKRIAEAEKGGVQFVMIPDLVQKIDPIRDVRAFFSIHTNPFI